MFTTASHSPGFHRNVAQILTEFPNNVHKAMQTNVLIQLLTLECINIKSVNVKLLFHPINLEILTCYVFLHAS